MSWVHSITDSVSVVTETNLEELWDKNASAQTSGGVLVIITLENLESFALNKVFSIASRSIDLPHFLHQLFQHWAIYPEFYFEVNLTVLLQHKFSVSVSLKHSYL